MPYGSNIKTSILGRRLGLQEMSSAQTGSGRGSREYLVGPEAFRNLVTTADTTASNLTPDGVSFISSAVSSGVYTLDPPVPGVYKALHFGTTGATNYVKTANGETFQSSQGTTFSVIKSTQNVVGTLILLGLTTAVWGMAPGLSTASFALSTTT
jgi:hypothetical protein